MSNIGINNMMKNLRALNKNGKFDINCSNFPNIIIGTIPTSKLLLPVGYYWNEKNGITNKHNTEDGLYESFTYEYNPNYFGSKTKVEVIQKRSLWSRLFG